MRKNSKNALYESIMRKVSKEIRRSLLEAEKEELKNEEPLNDEVEEEDDVDEIPGVKLDIDNYQSLLGDDETSDEEDEIEDYDDTEDEVESPEDDEEDYDVDTEDETSVESEEDSEEDDEETEVEATEGEISDEIEKTNAGKLAKKILSTFDEKSLYDFANILNSKRTRKEERQQFIDALISLSKKMVMKNLDENLNYRRFKIKHRSI